ncbi:MAG: cation diffusion facilitator family transporter [Actinomycetota bacterium]|nr:cation diffusion facilitator family transporter [Actinomycetota bacterium]
MSDKHAHRHDGGGHAGHSHAVAADADARWLTIALLINASFMGVEIVVGLAASSIALLSDAGHMVTDVAAIALALLAARLAQRAPTGSLTFGYKRAEILSALANGLTLLLLAVYFVSEALMRLADPPAVEAGLVLWVGLAGLLANGGAAYFLAKASRQSLNVQGAVQHNLIDAFGSIAAAAAAGVILLTDFQRADPIASLIISALMIRSGWGLVRDSGRVLLEAAPAGLDPRVVGGAMASSPGISEVHDLHVWELTTNFFALSAHVLVATGDDCHARRRQLEALLHEQFGIEHTTLQVDHERLDELLTITAHAGSSTT